MNQGQPPRIIKIVCQRSTRLKKNPRQTIASRPRSKASPLLCGDDLKATASPAQPAVKKVMASVALDSFGSLDDSVFMPSPIDDVRTGNACAAGATSTGVTSAAAAAF